MPDISATASGHPRQLFGRMPRMIALPVLASGASGVHCRSAAKSRWQFRANTSAHNFVVTFDESFKTRRRHSISNGGKTIRPTLHHYGLTTANLETMTKWYATVLGMAVVFETFSPLGKNVPITLSAAWVTNDE